MKYRILKVIDGKAGHITVSDGVIEAIRKNHQVEIIDLNIKIRAKFLIRILRFILKYNLLSSQWISSTLFMNLFYQNFHKPETKIDIVVSTGGDTQFVNIWLSRILNAMNIFCGTLKGVDSKYFTSIVSTSELGVPNSIKLDILPTRGQIKDINKKVQQFCEEKHLDKNKKYFVLLIGGNGSGYSYTEDEYEKLVHSFMLIVKKYDAKALITTSRRTGIKYEILLESLFSQYDKDIAYSVYFAQAAEKVVSIYLELSSAIFVTEESGSMISESLLSKKPIFTLYPKTIQSQVEYRLFLERLLDKKRMYRLSIAEGLAKMKYDSFVFEPLEKLPIDELAENLEPFLENFKNKI